MTLNLTIKLLKKKGNAIKENNIKNEILTQGKVMKIGTLKKDFDVSLTVPLSIILVINPLAPGLFFVSNFSTSCI